MARISEKTIKLVERFNKDLEAFRLQTEGEFATLYEDAYTTRNVKDFRLTKTGKLTWNEDGGRESEQMFDDDDAKDWLSFWRANLRRAKRYWEMEYKGCPFNGKTDEEARDMIADLLFLLVLTCKEQGWSLEHIAELTLAKLARKR